LQSTSSRSASSASLEDVDSTGVFALLDFLMGSSIDEVTRQHRLTSRIHTEAVIRALLLHHGYDAEQATFS
jgi:hypothetical protein